MPRRRKPKKKSRAELRRERFKQLITTPGTPAFDNATKAAELAGYSPRTARQQGSRLLSKVDVQQAIAEVKKRAAIDAEIDREAYLREALAQARAWLNDAGQPHLEPILHEGAVVHFLGEPLFRRWRPDNANVKALELAGRVAGFIKEGEVSSGRGIVAVQVNVGGVPGMFQTQPRQIEARVAYADEG